MIPAGTPIAQVIPFKRDSFKMSIGEDAERKESYNSNARLKSVFADAYRKFWREEKKYI